MPVTDHSLVSNSTLLHQIGVDVRDMYAHWTYKREVSSARRAVEGNGGSCYAHSRAVGRAVLARLEEHGLSPNHGQLLFQNEPYHRHAAVGILDPGAHETAAVEILRNNSTVRRVPLRHGPGIDAAKQIGLGFGGEFGYTNTFEGTINTAPIHKRDIATIILPLTVGLAFITDAQRLLDPTHYHDEDGVVRLAELARELPGFDDSHF